MKIPVQGVLTPEQRRPDLGAKEVHRGGCRHHADDRERLTVDAHGAPDDRRVRSEPRRPEMLAQDDHLRGGRPIVAGDEGAAQQRSQPEDVEVLIRDAESSDLHRCIERGNRGGGESDGGHRVERRVLRFPVEIVQRRHGIGLSGHRALFLDEHDPVRILVRKRTEKHAFHRAEDRRVRPDADRERQDGDRHESRRAAQRPNGVAQVLDQRFH